MLLNTLLYIINDYVCPCTSTSKGNGQGFSYTETVAIFVSVCVFTLLCASILYIRHSILVHGVLVESRSTNANMRRRFVRYSSTDSTKTKMACMERFNAFVGAPQQSRQERHR